LLREYQSCKRVSESSSTNFVHVCIELPSKSSRPNNSYSVCRLRIVHTFLPAGVEKDLKIFQVLNRVLSSLKAKYFISCASNLTVQKKIQYKKSWWSGSSRRMPA
jgi:hypothetical protein